MAAGDEKMHEGFLDVLLSRENSIAKVLENSRKLSLLFEDVQAAECTRTLRNFAFAAQRFDSTTMPLFKVLKLLPSLFHFLSRVSSLGDNEDAASTRFLKVVFNFCYLES